MSKLVFSFGQTISIAVSGSSMDVAGAGYPPALDHTVSTNSTEGLVIRGVTSTSATAPSKADIRAGSGTGTLEAFSHSVTGADGGDETEALTDTSEAATYVHYFVEEARNPPFSSDVVTIGDGTSFGFDFTPPVLSATSATPSVGAAAGAATIDVDVSTDKIGGRIAAVAVIAGDDAPNGWQILANLNARDALPEAYKDRAVTATGAQVALSLVKLNNGTAYDVYLVHSDDHGNQTVVSFLNVTPTA